MPAGDRAADRPSPGRLTVRAEFQAVGRRGRRVSSDRMTVQGLARADEGGVRVGLTVTKKVGCAPERNRIRRRLRAAAKAATTGGGAPLDLVLVARRDVLAAPFPVLVGDLRRALDILLKPRGPQRGPGPERPTAPHA